MHDVHTTDTHTHRKYTDTYIETQMETQIETQTVTRHTYTSMFDA